MSSLFRCSLICSNLSSCLLPESNLKVMIICYFFFLSSFSCSFEYKIFRNSFLHNKCEGVWLMNRSKHVPNLTLPMRERSITQQNQIKSKPIMILSKRKEKKRRKQNKKKEEDAS